MSSKKSALKVLANSIAEAIGRGDIVQLTRYLEEALQITPRNLDYLYNLGVCYFKKNRFDESRAVFLKALELEPRDVSILVNLAKVELESKHIDEARKYSEQAFLRQPDNLEVLQTYGSVLLNDGSYDQAFLMYQKALEKNPNDPLTLSFLGVYFLQIKDVPSSKNCLLRAWELNPKDKNTLMNLSQIALEEGEPLRALGWLEKMLELFPDATYVHHHMAVIYLGLFEWTKGWKEYMYREVHQLNPGVNKELPKDLLGKRLFIRYEQGLGDEIFFLRFLPELKRRGAWIAYMPRPKLYTLLKRADCIDMLVQEGDELLNIDYTFFVADLPYLLEVDSIEGIPDPLVLNVSHNETEALSRELDSYPKPFIGLTWRAGVQKLGYLSKEIALSELIPYLQRLNGTIVVLQRNPSEEDMSLLKEAFGNDLIDASGYNDDLDTMISLLAILDSYIAVSNTNIHLAGCIGKKCHILVPYPAEWRWGYQADELSPWYRLFSLYRQSAYNADWKEVFECLTSDIRGELFKREQVKHTQNILDESLSKMDELIRMGMFPEAERLGETILTVSQNDRRVLSNLVQIYNAMEQYEKMLRVLEMMK